MTSEEKENPPVERTNSGSFKERVNRVRLTSSNDPDKKAVQVDKLLERESWSCVFDLTIDVLCLLVYLMAWLIVGAPVVCLFKFVCKLLEWAWLGTSKLTIVSIKGVKSMGMFSVIVTCLIIIALIFLTPLICLIFS